MRLSSIAQILLKVHLPYLIIFLEQWQDWIEDEWQLAEGPEEKKAVLKLIEKALDDITSKISTKDNCKGAPLGEYIVEYSLELFKEGVLKKRGVEIYLEKMISHFCNHFIDGSIFFKSLREFIEQNTEKKDEATKQIRALYVRQLKINKADLMVTWNEYQQWETDSKERSKNKEIYEENLSMIEKYLDIDEKFVLALSSSSIDNVVRTMEMISIKDILTPERKLNYFARCVDAKPNIPAIWDLYLALARDYIKSPGLLEHIYAKAYKNNPKNINIAVTLLRTMEKAGIEKLTIECNYPLIQ